MLADQTETTQSPILRGLLPVRGMVLALATFCGRKPLGAAGGAILLVLIVIAVLAPVISPHHHGEIHAKQIYEKPGRDFPLGSDLLGRDVLSRIFHGGRISLFVGLVSISIGITAGSLLGAPSAPTTAGDLT